MNKTDKIISNSSYLNKMISSTISSVVNTLATQISSTNLSLTSNSINNTNLTTMFTNNSISTTESITVNITDSNLINITLPISTTMNTNLTTMATIIENMNYTTTEIMNTTDSEYNTNNTLIIQYNNDSFPVKMVLLPLLFVFGLCIIGGVILFIIRKNKLERLRHHLMPIYNFDASEDGEDWETELLDDNFPTQKLDFPNSGLKMGGLTGGLNLKNTFPSVDFNNGNFNNNNYSSNRNSKSPTPSSGLLSSNNNTKSLYTSEKPIV